MLAAVGTFAPLVERGHVFATLPEAVAHATQHIGEVDEPDELVVGVPPLFQGLQPFLTKG